MTAFSPERFMAVQNLISAKVDAGEMPFEPEDVAVMSYALGLAHGHLWAQLSEARALLERVRNRGLLRGGGALHDDVKAFLAGQPAPPAAPTERVTFTTVRGETLSSCTMADVEVLKELDSVPTAALEHWREHGTVLQSNLAVVELKRRRIRP